MWPALSSGKWFGIDYGPKRALLVVCTKQRESSQDEPYYVRCERFGTLKEVHIDLGSKPPQQEVFDALLNKHTYSLPGLQDTLIYPAYGFSADIRSWVVN